MTSARCLAHALPLILALLASSSSFSGSGNPNPASNPGVTQNQERPYVTVNGHPIPKARADAMTGMLPPARNAQDGETIRKTVSDELIRRELAAQEAARRGLDRRPDVRAQIDIAIQSVLVSAYLSEYSREHPVSDEALRREYEGIRSALGNREYKVRHILLGSAEEANTVLEKLRRGAKFEDLARLSKDTISRDRGGDLGWVNAATYVRPFAEVVTQMKKGTRSSQPVQTEFGWHVIQLDDIRDLKAPTLAEIRPQLVQRLQQQIVDRHLAELRAKARIE